MQMMLYPLETMYARWCPSYMRILNFQPNTRLPYYNDDYTITD
jgi:hypothetical protein